MCGYIPHIHSHPNFLHYAQNKLSNIILIDFEHNAIIIIRGGGGRWGTLIKKSKKYVSKNIRCNILVIG